MADLLINDENNEALDIFEPESEDFEEITVGSELKYEKIELPNDFGDSYINEKKNEPYTSGPSFTDEKWKLENLTREIRYELDNLQKASPLYTGHGQGMYAVVHGGDDGTEHIQLQYAKKNNIVDITKINQLKNRIASPYRFRVDLKENGRVNTYYVGPEEYQVKGRRVISEYSNFGSLLVKYNRLDPGLSNSLMLRRELNISDGKLKYYQNNFIYSDSSEYENFRNGVTDPYLIELLLARRANHEPTDIIATIQEEQNKIVEMPANYNMIVQGCAGSGKTMVMMQRLSRLQNWEKAFDPNQVMIISPSNQYDMFMKAVKEGLAINVLQSMSVESYYQSLLLRYGMRVKNRIRSDFSVKEQKIVEYVYSDAFITDFTINITRGLEKRAKVINDIHTIASRFGVDVNLYDWERCADEYERERFCSQTSGKIQRLLAPTNTMKDIGQQIDSIAKEIDLINELLEDEKDSALISEREEKEDEISRLRADYICEVEKTYEVIPKSDQANFSLLRNELQSLYGNGLYKQALQDTFNYYNSYSGLNIVHPIGLYKFDLYAMLIFCDALHDERVGTHSFLCIDEGQDLSINEYNLLRKIHPENTIFNVYGDVNQTLNLKTGVDEWDNIRIAIGYPKELKLNDNYRNTNQITQFCNRSFSLNTNPIGINGANVEYVKPEGFLDRLKLIDDSKGCRSVILIPHSVDKKTFIKNNLNNEIANVSTSVIDKDHISLMYVSEVKGLEFDNVFMFGDDMSRNEAYIASTRAMESLICVGSRVYERSKEMKSIMCDLNPDSDYMASCSLVPYKNTVKEYADVKLTECTINVPRQDRKGTVSIQILYDEKNRICYIKKPNLDKNYTALSSFFLWC